MTAEQAASLTAQEETTDDAILAAQLLGQTQGIDAQRLFVLGHSLGAMLAPRIGQYMPGLAGLVLMAAPARPLEDVTLDQYFYLASLGGQPDDSTLAYLTTLQTQVARVKSPELSLATAAEDLPVGIPAAFWLDLRGYHPVETALSLNMPLLVLQGGRDYQVLANKDFSAWQQALAGRPKSTLKLYPALNHLFISGEGPSIPDEYTLEGHVSEAVINDIARWIFNKE
jgi:pimeloyl-ACP methyl ester carboxylesterase